MLKNPAASSERLSNLEKRICRKSHEAQGGGVIYHPWLFLALLIYCCILCATLLTSKVPLMRARRSQQLFMAFVNRRGENSVLHIPYIRLCFLETWLCTNALTMSWDVPDIHGEQADFPNGQEVLSFFKGLLCLREKWAFCFFKLLPSAIQKSL